MSNTTDLVDAPSGSSEATAGITSGDTTAPASERSRRRAGARTGLAGMVLPGAAGSGRSLGISGTGRMRKSQLIEIIQQRQRRRGCPSGGGPSAGRRGANCASTDQLCAVSLAAGGRSSSRRDRAISAARAVGAVGAGPHEQAGKMTVLRNRRRAPGFGAHGLRARRLCARGICVDGTCVDAVCADRLCAC